MVGGMKLEANMGIPMPRLAYLEVRRKIFFILNVFRAHIPSLNSQAARRTIFSLILAAGLNSLLLSVV